MKINFEEVPSPSTLIATMDKHPAGAAMFVAVLAILAVAVVVCGFLYFGRP